MAASEAKDTWKLPIGFPKGLRVLLVDDDSLCLKIVERMLCSCEFSVTTCTNGQNALHLLREKPHGFDLVISDVYMPDMDGFKLLELVGLEMDLPVIMMSSNGETGTVLRGVTHGAVDFLIKPVRIEELRNIWQHVLRRRRELAKEPDSEEQSQEAKEEPQDASRKRKEAAAISGELERSGDGEEGFASKKARVVWSVEMHQQFVNAVNQLGVDRAVPKRILEIMNVGGLTRENVASHLQKYRLYLKRVASVQGGQGVGASMGLTSGGSHRSKHSATLNGHTPSLMEGGAANTQAPDAPSQLSQPPLPLPDPALSAPSPALQAALQQQQHQVGHVSEAMQLAGLTGGACLPQPFPSPLMLGGNPMAMMGAGPGGMNPMLGMAGMNSLHPMGLPGMAGLPGMMHGMQGMGGLTLAGMQAQAQAGLAGMGGLPGMAGMPGMAGLAGMQSLMGGMAGMAGLMHGMHGMNGMGGLPGMPGLPPLPGGSANNHDALLRGMQQHHAHLMGQGAGAASACTSQSMAVSGMQSGSTLAHQQGQQGQQGPGHQLGTAGVATQQHNSTLVTASSSISVPRLSSDLAPLPDDPSLFGLQGGSTPGSGPMGGTCGPPPPAHIHAGCMMTPLDHLDQADVSAAFADLYSPDDTGILTLHAADSKEGGLDEVLNFLLKS